MYTKYFKMDFSVKQITNKIHFLHSPTIHSLIVLIWFLLTVLHESGKLDAILIVCRKKKKKKK